jgi:hypothetical protein
LKSSGEFWAVDGVIKSFNGDGTKAWGNINGTLVGRVVTVTTEIKGREGKIMSGDCDPQVGDKVGTIDVGGHSSHPLS